MVKWSRRARADLKAIHDRIAVDAPGNAKKVAQEILRKADTLAELPYAGRKVPETNDDHLREVSAYSWRILYHIRDNEVFVVTLMHKRRQPGADDIGSGMDG